MITHYGTVGGGDDYFAQRLRTSAWDNASEADKTKALFEATAAIDRLAFKGYKSDSDQELSFPRNGEEDVPDAIVSAAYELAIVLLDEIDPELEVRTLGVTGESYGNVRTTYERAFIQQGILAGIPSETAWQYLQPYLSDPGELTLSRVS